MNWVKRRSNAQEKRSLKAEAELITIQRLSLGRGTSTEEGFNLAYSIAEHLARDIQCFSFFTTHLTELSDLAANIQTCRNFSVNGVSQYQIQPGYNPESLGLTAARAVGFEERVLEDAQKEVESYEAQLENPHSVASEMEEDNSVAGNGGEDSDVIGNSSAAGSKHISAETATDLGWTIKLASTDVLLLIDPTSGKADAATIQALVDKFTARSNVEKRRR
jgi:DNA mismatch repair ATPase MutS